MIKIYKSRTAGIDYTDPKAISDDELIMASREHIQNVAMALSFFIQKLTLAAAQHDYDKLTDKETFHKAVRGIDKSEWAKKHVNLHRHHLGADGAIPEDVNLVDVLEYISDCVVSGMANKGRVTNLNIDADALMKAFTNTVSLLIDNIEIKENT